MLVALWLATLSSQNNISHAVSLALLCSQLHKAFVLEVASENAFLWSWQLLKIVQKHALFLCKFLRVLRLCETTLYSCTISKISENCTKVDFLLIQFSEALEAAWEQTPFFHSFCSLQKSHENGCIFIYSCWVLVNVSMSPKTLWCATFDMYIIGLPLLW